jgi:hypothetical protein
MEKSPSPLPKIKTGSAKKKWICTPMASSIKKKILTIDLSLKRNTTAIS